MKNKNSALLLVVLLLLTVAIACDLSFDRNEDNQELEFQLTRESIRKTQQALEDAIEESPQSEPEAPPEEESDTVKEKSAEEEDDDSLCNRSKFVSETIPDNTAFEPGEAFEKTWTVRNAGTCDWNTNYTFRFTQGTRMGGVSSMNMPSVIKPNETITFKLDLTAPDDPGTYTGRWQIFADDGKELGWYSVVIEVKPAGPPPAAFAVTSVSFYMPHTTIDMGCPGDVSIKAEIATSAGGEVTYKWEDTAGGSSSTKSVTFSGAEKKIVDYTAAISSPGDYEASLYIDNPNHQWFGPKSFHVNCTP